MLPGMVFLYSARNVPSVTGFHLVVSPIHLSRDLSPIVLRHVRVSPFRLAFSLRHAGEWHVVHKPHFRSFWPPATFMLPSNHWFIFVSLLALVYLIHNLNYVVLIGSIFNWELYFELDSKIKMELRTLLKYMLETSTYIEDVRSYKADPKEERILVCTWVTYELYILWTRTVIPDPTSRWTTRTWHFLTQTIPAVTWKSVK